MKKNYLEHKELGYTFSCCSFQDNYFKQSFLYGRFDKSVVGIYDTNKDKSFLDINLEDKNAACLNIDYYEKVIYTVDDSMTVRLYDVRSEDLIYDVNMKKFSDKNW